MLICGNSHLEHLITAFLNLLGQKGRKADSPCCFWGFSPPRLVGERQQCFSPATGGYTWKGDEMTKKQATYSIEEVGNIFGISRTHAYKMVKEGVIKCLEFGNRKVIPKRWVDELLNNKSFSSDSQEKRG